MGMYWRLIGHYNGEAQTFEALAGAFQTSPYTHDEDANLIGIRVMPSGEAATSLTEGVQYRLSCTQWKPNVIHVCSTSNGIRTAPAQNQPPIDFQVNQPVKAGVPITIEARHNVATAVTSNQFVMGLFQS